MGVRVEIQEGRELAKKFKEMGRRAKDGIDKVLLQAGYLVEKEAKIRCPVDTGRLRASITTRLGQGEKAVAVGSNVEYAAAVEFGSEQEWTQTIRVGAKLKKPKVDPKTGRLRTRGKNKTESITIRHARKIAKPFLGPALEAKREDILRLVDDYTQKLVKEAGQ